MTPANRGGKRPRQTRFSSADRRESILHAARAVFVRQGYSGARTKDIATEAGINEALIYRHFQSKEELFDSAVIEPLERWMSTYPHLGEKIPRAVRAEDRLALLQKTAIEFMREIEMVLPLLGIALFGSEGHGAEFYRKRLVPLIDRWAERTSLSMPLDARGAAFDPRFFAKTGIGISIFLAADAYFRGEPFDHAEAGANLSRMMLPMYQADPAKRKTR
jgi:AcrR family transcriptional regulator